MFGDDWYINPVNRKEILQQELGQLGDEDLIKQVTGQIATIEKNRKRTTIYS